MFGDRLAPAGDAALTATGDRTDLADAVRGVVERHRGQGLSAIVVLSDGNDTSGEDLEAAGRAAGVPIVAVGLGRADGADREVVALATGQSSLDASLVDLTATLAARHLPGSFDVRLLQNGQVVERRSVTPASDGAPMRVAFTVAPDRNAPTVYTIDVPAAEAELTPANNQARALVPPPGRRRLLLSLEGAPGFEQTFLKRAWSDDPSLEVDAAVRKGRNEQGADTFFVQAGGARASTLVTGFPSTREALFAYDAVVLADYDLHLLSRESQEWLRAFVSERGGGLLFAGARTFEPQGLAGSPLEELLPLRLGDGGGVVRAASTSAEDRYRVRPTAEGTRHPMMRIAATDQEARSRWANLPSLAGVVQLGGARPGASVLAVMDELGSNSPVVAVQRFGAGRTALFAGQASWRWKMLRPASDGSYDRFWRQTARWLTADALEPDHGDAAGLGAARRSRGAAHRREDRGVCAVAAGRAARPGGSARRRDASTSFLRSPIRRGGCSRRGCPRPSAASTGPKSSAPRARQDRLGRNCDGWSAGSTASWPIRGSTRLV